MKKAAIHLEKNLPSVKYDLTGDLIQSPSYGLNLMFMP